MYLRLVWDTCKIHVKCQDTCILLDNGGEIPILWALRIPLSGSMMDTVHVTWHLHVGFTAVCNFGRHTAGRKSCKSKAPTNMSDESRYRYRSELKIYLNKYGIHTPVDQRSTSTSCRFRHCVLANSISAPPSSAAHQNSSPAMSFLRITRPAR